MNKKIQKSLIFRLILIIVSVVCVSLLLPDVRSAIIQAISDNILHRSLNQTIWDAEIVMVGATGLMFFAGVFLVVQNDRFLLPPSSNEPRYRIINIVLIAIYAFVAIIYAAINDAFWYDEAFTLSVCSHSWSEIIALINTDCHPPLYFLFVKLTALLFGNSIFVAKITSLIPMLLTMVCSTIFLHREFSPRTAFLFLLSFLSLNCTLTFGTEIRMYSLAMMFFTGITISSWYIANTGGIKWWIVYIFCFVGCEYTHHYATLAAGIAFAVLFIFLVLYRKDQIRSALFAIVIILIFFIPVLKTVFGQISGVSGESYWIADSTSIQALLSYIVFLFDSGSVVLAVLFFLVFCALSLYCIAKFKKEPKNIYAISCIICFLMFLTVNMLIAAVFRPLFVGRYLTPLVPTLLFFLSIEVQLHTDRLKSTIFSCFLGALALMSISSGFVREMEDNKEFNSFRASISDNIQPDDVFLYSNTSIVLQHVSGIIAYLFPNHIHIFPDNSVDALKFNEKQLPLKLADYKQYSFVPQVDSCQMWILCWEDDDIEKILNEVAKTGVATFCGLYHRSSLTCQLYRVEFKQR